LHLKKDCWLFLVTASPHSIQRGIGSYAHDSLESGKLIIEFKSVLSHYKSNRLNGIPGSTSVD
jgi:hypothetical protein